MPRRPNPFASYCTASRRVTSRRYPEEWAWWRASGWQMLVEDKEDGGLRLHTLLGKGGKTSLWGGSADAEEVATPELVRHFLTETLYLHLHSIKARRSYESTGHICTDTELAAFIRQQRRKVGKPAQ